jgi:hypothetical protein
MVFKYFIEFSLAGSEGRDRFGRVIWAKGRWPILFDSRAEAAKYVQSVTYRVFANKHLAGIQSAAITGVRIS